MSEARLLLFGVCVGDHMFRGVVSFANIIIKMDAAENSELYVCVYH